MISCDILIIKILSKCIWFVLTSMSIFSQSKFFINKPQYQMRFMSLKKTIYFAYKLINSSSRSIKYLIYHKSFRSLFLALRFFISMLSAISKTCLLFLYYVIVMVISWSWSFIIKKSSLLYLVSCASCFIVFSKGLALKLIRLWVG